MRMADIDPLVKTLGGNVDDVNYVGSSDGRWFSTDRLEKAEGRDLTREEGKSYNAKA